MYLEGVKNVNSTHHHINLELLKKEIIINKCIFHNLFCDEIFD